MVHASALHGRYTQKSILNISNGEGFSFESASMSSITAATITKRKGWKFTLAAALGVVSVFIAQSAALNATTAAADDDKLISLYFGVGCFWHIQHEFVQAERELLGRNDHELTASTGYAGGRTTGSDGRVCYHNWRGIADYGKLGHAEVVGMVIPESAVGDFAKVYFSLFDPRTKGNPSSSFMHATISLLIATCTRLRLPFLTIPVFFA
jgi:hypothetical protein